MKASTRLVPARDGRALQRLDVLAHILDELVQVPGTRIRVGLDALIGLIPGFGDVVAGAIGAYAIVIAGRLGAPPSVLARMVGNVVVDVVVGSVPLLGDLFDIGWKANRRNVQLLMAYRAAPTVVNRRSSLIVGAALALLLVAVGAVAWVTFIVLRWLLQSVV